MRIRFTAHAKAKYILLKHAGFPIKRQQVINCLVNPLKTDKRPDGTIISTFLISEKHILRVVYKTVGDTMLVITFYPGRRKAYGF